MKKLKFKDMEEKKGRQKKKNMEEPGLCSTFFCLLNFMGCTLM